MVEISTIKELRRQLLAVARARAEVERLVAEKMEALAKWEQEHQPLLDAAKTASEYKADQETLLREMTIGAYEETGSKHPVAGVDIREVMKLDYDPAQAFSYAKEHGVSLKLDISAFEKMAKIPELRPGFVTAFTEPQATIATDLSKVLEATEVN